MMIFFSNPIVALSAEYPQRCFARFSRLSFESFPDLSDFPKVGDGIPDCICPPWPGPSESIAPPIWLLPVEGPSEPEPPRFEFDVELVELAGETGAGSEYQFPLRLPVIGMLSGEFDEGELAAEEDPSAAPWP